ncbi:MAG: hypothetical protein E7607_01495 [Ruminococcaceae bacterium]|nr:hypothetical protein [Oscillospiraceae bacterium]
MKKYLSLFLAIVMVLTIAIPVFAADENSPFKIGDIYYDTLLEAVAAAEDGDTIEMLKDYTMDGVTQNQIKITKSITIDGGNHTLTFNASAANVFPILVDAAGKVVTIQNFAEITSSGGGISVGNGTLNLNGVTVTGKGRAAVKTQNGSAAKAINVENSTIRMALDAGKTEATMILSGGQASTLTLGNGAVVEKASKANSATMSQSSVIYFLDNGAHSIVMNSGSKIIAKQAVDHNATTVIGLADAKGANAITINEGAHFVVETSIPTVYFLSSNVGGNTTITAHDNAFLVKEDLTPTLPGYTADMTHGGTAYNWEESTSSVAGYKAYKMVENTNVDYNFEIIKGEDSANFAGSLKDALNLSTDGSTIKFLKDYTNADVGITLSGKSITVDLNNFKLGNSNGSNYFITSLKSGLTFKNGTVETIRGIVVQDGGHLAFENVTATAIQNGSSERPMVKLSGKGATRLTVNNATLELKGTNGESLILCEHGTTATINVTGNSVIKYSGNVKGNDQNHVAIAVQKGNTDGTSLTLNVGAGSSLVAAHIGNADRAGKIAAIIADQTNGTITVNLEAGATLKADRTLGADNVTKTAFINQVGSLGLEGENFVNDNGANWVISADVAKQGIALPANVFGYKIGDNIVNLAEGNVYKNEAATEAVTISAIFYSFKPEMIKGAAMRLELPFGLRFGATISADEFEAIKVLDPNAEVGFVVAKKGDAGSKFDTATMMESKYKFMPATTVVNADGTVTFETNVYIGEDSVITSADKSGFKTNVAAKAYVKATIGGQEVYYFADYSMAENSRSLYNVAQSYVADTVDGSTENIVANYIIAVSEAK